MKFCKNCGESCIQTMVLCNSCGSRDFTNKNSVLKKTTKISQIKSSHFNQNMPKVYFKEKNIAYALAFIFCIIALFPMPYGFYILLRLVITTVAIFSMIELKKEGSQFWYFFIGVAILFNPIFPIYLSKSIWMPIDLIVAGSFAWMIIKQKFN